MQQIGHDLIRLPPFRRYTGPREVFQSFEGIQEALEEMEVVVNQNNRNLFRGIRSSQNYFGRAIDDEGYPRVQVHDKHFERHTIGRDRLDRSCTPFETDLMFRVATAGGSWRLVWAQNGNVGTNANIYWAGTGLVNIIDANNAILSGTVNKATYAYIDPRNNDYTVTTTENIRDALSDGKVILCRVRSDQAANIGWRNVGWGGGIHLKA